MVKTNHTPTQLPLPLEGATVEIPLSQGFVAVVDAIDADLSQFKWSAANEKGKVYAFRRVKIGFNQHKKEWLHRVILERVLGRQLEGKEFTDHRNSNGIDDRRENLRLATQRQNTANRKLNKNNTSGYKGVHFNRNNNSWIAEISSGNEKFNLGRFDNPQDAYAAYCKAARELHGEFARLE